MNKVRAITLFGVCLIFLFDSCSVQKRRYQKGLYIARAAKIKKHSADPALKTPEKGHTSFSQKQVQYEIPPPLYATAEQQPELEVWTNTRKPYLHSQPGDSCDVIELRTGEKVKARVLEIGITEIRYKRCDMAEGPLFVARKDEVKMITYQSGRSETFPEDPEVREGASKNHSPVVAPKRHQGVTLTIVLAVLGWVILIGSIPAIISGFVTLSDIRNMPHKYTTEGRGGVIAAIIFSFLKLILLTLLYMFAITGRWFI